jgi:hypothetical protein
MCRVEKRSVFASRASRGILCNGKTGLADYAALMPPYG